MKGNEKLPSSTKTPKPLTINGLGKKEKNSNKKRVTKTNNPVSKLDTMDKKNLRLFSANDDLTKAWFIDFYDDLGRRKQIKGGINRGKTITERYEIANALILTLQSGVQIKKPTNNLKTAIDKAIERQCIGKRKKTKGAYKTKTNAFIQYCNRVGVYNTEGVTVDLATNFILYLKEIPLANSTTENYREKLKTLFDQINGITKNPFREIKAISYHVTPARPYQSHEIERLKEYITEHDPQLWFFILFIINCLIRPNSELRLLTIGDIDFENELILIPAHISKNGKPQWVVIPNDLMTVINNLKLKDYPPNYFIFSKSGTPGINHVSYNYFYKRHRVILEQLGFFRKGYNLYSYKHYGALTMVRNGVPLMEIKEQGRWHSLDQMTAYLKGFGVKDMNGVKNFKYK